MVQSLLLGWFTTILNLEQFLEFVIKYQDERTASTTENVGQGALEEGTSTFLLADLNPAVQCVLVHDFTLCTARLHHHASSDCVEWI